MEGRIIAAALLAVLLLCPRPSLGQGTDDLQAQINQIKAQLSELDTLKAKLAELEAKLEEARKNGKEAKTPETNAPVQPTIKGVNTTINGRLFAEITGSGDQGSYPNSTADVPDLKLRFTFHPSKRVTIVNRLSAASGRSPEFDYLYGDYAGVWGPANVLRLGQHKVDFGQEAWTLDPVEGVVISSSVGRVTSTATGLEFLGRFRNDPGAPLYTLGMISAPKGVLSRPTNALAWNAKLGSSLPGGFFISGSYFDSGRLDAANKSPLTIADIADAPPGAITWRRRIWEGDLRYDYGPNGIRPIIPSANLPRFMLGGAYGRFPDDTTGVRSRDGRYWYAEGLYNLSRQFYTGARYSVVNLDDGLLANLGKSPVPVNAYRRTAIGLGYRLSPLTDLKTEYTINDADGGPTKPSLNQWAVGLASRF